MLQLHKKTSLTADCTAQGYSQQCAMYFKTSKKSFFNVPTTKHCYYSYRPLYSAPIYFTHNYIPKTVSFKKHTFSSFFFYLWLWPCGRKTNKTEHPLSDHVHLRYSQTMCFVNFIALIFKMVFQIQTKFESLFSIWGRYRKYQWINSIQSQQAIFTTIYYYKPIFSNFNITNVYLCQKCTFPHAWC